MVGDTTALRVARGGVGRGKGEVGLHRVRSGAASVQEQRCKVRPSYSHIHGAVDDDICKYGVKEREDMSLVSHGCACMHNRRKGAQRRRRARLGGGRDPTPRQLRPRLYPPLSVSLVAVEAQGAS